MPTITLTQIVEAIRLELDGIASFKQVQGGSTITESIPETPLGQVYVETVQQDVTSQTDQTTFGTSPTRQTQIIVHVDVYARVRSNIGTDMAAIMTVADAVITELESQPPAKPFSLTGLRAFNWTANRVIFTYANQELVGMRFVLTFRVY